MKRKLICALLCLGLCLPMAQAALLPTVNTYPGFADVKEGDWFYDNAKLCSEVGLMNGTDQGFEPERLLSVAECAAVAARIREALTGEPIPDPVADPSLPWYLTYLHYMTVAAPSLESVLAVPEMPSTRLQYLLLLNAALPQDRDLLSAINSITTLPDTGDSVVLSFYNAGVLTGVDDYGTFDGGKPLSRAECAAMVSRVIQPELRVSFTPKAHEPFHDGGETHQPAHDGGEGHDHQSSQTGSAGFTSPAALEGTNIAMTVNGRMVDQDLFEDILVSVIYEQDAELYQYTGEYLDWNKSYQGVGDLNRYFLERAMSEAVTYSILSAKAKELGCEINDLPARLFSSPSKSELDAAIQKYDLLCAKHILVEDAETANAVIGGLDAAPTMEQFDALLSVFGEDPGMKDNPDGYLFSPGEMVTQFEAGTRALDIGTYSSQPVQSNFGYHIIWRLDPAQHPEFLAQYQQTLTAELLDTWLKEANVVLNEPLISSIDPESCYAAYWIDMAAQQGPSQR